MYFLCGFTCGKTSVLGFIYNFIDIMQFYAESDKDTI